MTTTAVAMITDDDPAFEWLSTLVAGLDPAHAADIQIAAIEYARNCAIRALDNLAAPLFREAA